MARFATEKQIHHLPAIAPLSGVSLVRKAMATTRKALSKKTRFEVFKRDGFKCMYCGAHPPAVLLQVDHIHAVALGGTNDMDNLITSCQPCNLGKSATPLSAVPQGLAEMAAETREREEQIKGYQAVMASKRKRLDQEVLQVAELFKAEFGEASVMPDQRLSIKHFISAIGLDECMAAMEIALCKKPFPNRSAVCFKYFCGVCWTKARANPAFSAQNARI